MDCDLIFSIPVYKIRKVFDIASRMSSYGVLELKDDGMYFSVRDGLNVTMFETIINKVEFNVYRPGLYPIDIDDFWLYIKDLRYDDVLHFGSKGNYYCLYICEVAKTFVPKPSKCVDGFYSKSFSERKPKYGSDVYVVIDSKVFYNMFKAIIDSSHGSLVTFESNGDNFSIKTDYGCIDFIVSLKSDIIHGYDTDIVHGGFCKSSFDRSFLKDVLKIIKNSMFTEINFGDCNTIRFAVYDQFQNSKRATAMYLGYYVAPRKEIGGG